MIIACGTKFDRRVININLPPNRQSKIGVFVSGGIDSALLYYLLMWLNSIHNNTYQITPFTMLRKEGSKHYALPVINYVNSIFNKPDQQLITVGDTTLPEDQQVRSGIQDVFSQKLADVVYVGVIQTLDIHMIGWQPIVSKETSIFKTPFSNINKSHIIDLVYILKQEALINLTHSCIHDTGKCYNCNGCNERSWAFEQLGRIDTGTI